MRRTSLFKRRVLIPLAVLLIALLVAVRAALPIYVQRYVNRVLDENENYSGQIGDVDLFLWRGAYTIRDVQITKTTGKVPVPLFSSPLVDLSIEWRQIWNGALVGEVRFVEPELNFVAGPSDSVSQTGEEGDWTATVRKLFPLRINRLEVNNGRVRYRDFHSDPRVDVHLDDVEAEARNLTNSEEISESLVAHVHATARAERHAPVEISLNLDPYAETPVFKLQGSLEGLRLPTLNDLLRAYANVDAEGGTISLFTELTSTERSFKGYLKPLVRDVELVSISQDADRPLAFLWESLVGLVTEIFSNQRKDQFATVIPLSGTYENPEAGVLSTLAGVLENAFLKALRPGLEKKSREDSDDD